MAIVTRTEAKAHLNITTEAHDTELDGYLDAATTVVEHYVGSVEQRTVTETHSGTGAAELVLRKAPAISITTVVEDGSTLDAGDYALTASGMLVRMAGSLRRAWRCGVNNIEVTFEAGRSAVPAGYKLAGLIIIGHLWETQYNLAGGRPQFGELETMGSGTFDPRFGFAIPRRATELLQDFGLPGV